MTLKIFERFSQADNIFQSLRPLTYISLIGLAPFSLHSKKEVRTSVLSFVAGVVHFLFFVLCFFLSLKEGDSIIGYFFQTNITKLGDATLSLTGIIAMLTIFGFATFKRTKLIHIIQNNLVVDEIFVGLGMKLDYQKILVYSFVISVGMMVFNVIYLCVSYMLLRSAQILPSFVVFTSFALPHINISIMVFKFLCTTYLAKSRFHMLNEVLQDILDWHIEERNASELSPLHSIVRINHSSGSGSGSVTGTARQYRSSNVIMPPTPSTISSYSIVSIIRHKPEFALKQITNIHNLLCDICNTIEDYFSYPILAIIAISFLFILFDDFYILEVMLTPTRLETFEAEEFFAFFVTQMLWYVVIIFLLVEGSSKTIKESKKCASIVHKILNITDDLEVRDRLLRFSLQLTHRHVHFTAAGLFNLDRTLIFTITGAATCYLIILIQFRGGPTTDGSLNCSTKTLHNIAAAIP